VWKFFGKERGAATPAGCIASGLTTLRKITVNWLTGQANLPTPWENPELRPEPRFAPLALRSTIGVRLTGLDEAPPPGNVL
jgi:hypothetical protein